MEASANRVFISYRRDDAAGYAGRLEEALEQALGRGSVFRDVLDIAPGEDFVHAIEQRLGGAQAVLVLIGPRWAGGDVPGSRRIDDAQDFVRLEVATSLARGLRVIPVLLPGAAMPDEAALPEPLKPLARRNAMPLTDAHWRADVQRLVAALGGTPRRAVWPWVLLGAAVAAVAVAAVCALWPRPAAAPAPAASAPAGLPDASQRWPGRWSAEVRYDWGAQVTEVFDFKRHAGLLTGTATFIGYPRGIEQVQADGSHLRFVTRTQERSGEQTYDLTHQYSIEHRGAPPDEVLAVRVHTTGGFGGGRKPVEYEARRAPASPPAAASR
jgi:TIR domain